MLPLNGTQACGHNMASQSRVHNMPGVQVVSHENTTVRQQQHKWQKGVSV